MFSGYTDSEIVYVNHINKFNYIPVESLHIEVGGVKQNYTWYPWRSMTLAEALSQNNLIQIDNVHEYSLSALLLCQICRLRLLGACLY